MPNKPLRIEGNKGGDYLEITDLGDGKVHLEVGHCCVRTLHVDAPIELVTLALSNVASHGLIGSMYESGWPSTYTDELVKEIVFYA